MNRWQDISTAPKDGTEFLAFDSLTKKQDVCRWSEAFKWFEAVQSDGEYGPCSDEFGYDRAGITHWQPLPPSPVD